MDRVLLYLFWTHEEDGPEYLTATADITSVDRLYQAYKSLGWNACDWSKVDLELQQILKLDREHLLNMCSKGYNLMDGWGGLHFQVIELGKEVV